MAEVTKPLPPHNDETENGFDDPDIIFLDWKEMSNKVFERQVELLDKLGVDVIVYDFQGDALVYKFSKRSET